MTIISAIVTWKGATFNVKVDTVKPVEQFRLQLQTLTGVPCDGQKIMGFPGGVLKASSWDEILLKGDKISVIMSGESDPAAAAAAPSAAAAAPSAAAAAPSAVTDDAAIGDQLVRSTDIASSRDAKLINVTVKTAKGTVMRLPNITADSRFDRIKDILSQQPHCCGQPLAMKLIFKGKHGTLVHKFISAASLYVMFCSARLRISLVLMLF
jgi:hypothetical protein